MSINDTFWVIKMTLVGDATTWSIIVMTLELSFMIVNVKSTGHCITSARGQWVQLLSLQLTNGHSKLEYLVLGQPFTGENLSSASFLSRLPALPANIRLGRKGLPGTNTLAYWTRSLVTKEFSKFSQHSLSKGSLVCIMISQHLCYILVLTVI